MLISGLVVSAVMVAMKLFGLVYWTAAEEFDKAGSSLINLICYSYIFAVFIYLV